MLTMPWQVLYILLLIVTAFFMITFQFYALRLCHVSGAGWFADCIHELYPKLAQLRQGRKIE